MNKTLQGVKMADGVTKKRNIKKFKHNKKGKKDESFQKEEKNHKPEKKGKESVKTDISQKKKGKTLSTIKDAESSFKLNDILELGGGKEDYENLLGIDENEEIETGIVQDDDISKLQIEVQNFMQAIGFEDEKDEYPVNNVRLKKDKIDVGKEDNKASPSKQKETSNKKVSDDSLKEATNTTTAKKKKKKTASEEPTKSLSYEKYDRLLLKNSLPWYELTQNIPKTPTTLYENETDKLYTIVKQYWDTEVEIYQNMKENDRSSDAKWLRTVLTSGTQSDKVAALTMLTQESPVHALRSLDALMNMSQKKARREALIAIDSLRHLWIADLLPDYKLRKFNEIPLEKLHEYNKSNTKEERIKLLVTMAYEEHLKKTYSEFVEIIRTFSKDPLSDIRNKILGIVFELLSMKPEQEQVLLSILVNKLGDPERKVASKASYLLCELVTKHPNMKMIIINEVERMMYRPNMSDKAQYYAICFLNQIVLSHQEKNVATKLISIYFSFFKVVVSRNDKAKSKKHTMNELASSHQNKLLSGLLTGVNRAYPYVEGMDETYDEQLNTLFRLTHMKHFNTSIQAFMLIYQVMESRQSVSDRYYQALYAKLLDPDINTSKHTMFLNLLYKSMKNDPVLKRVKAFIKRLLQVCSQYQPSLLCGVLYLISEVIKHHPGVNSMVEQAEEQDEEEHFVDAALDEEVMKKFDSSDDEECENKDDKKTEQKVKSSWTFLKQDDKHVAYNANNRNPLYSGTENVCLWETLPLLSYFHPSVTHFTGSIVNTKGIGYKGDPSQDFTLISFLDRFMYRNPKQKEVDHGSSLMQRKDVGLRRKEEPVNSKSFLQKSEENIPRDQIFFYRYFKQKMADEKELTKDEEKEDTFDTELADVDDIDFAGEIKRDGDIRKGNKKNKRAEKSDSESEDKDVADDHVEEEDDDDNEDKFDYDNMEDESSDEEEFKEKGNYNDKDYEKALFETLDSDGESINEENVENEDGAEEMNSMFADADEFSHLLEGDDVTDGVHKKQIQWEEKQEQSNWKFKKSRNNKGNLKRKKNFHNDNRNIKKKKMKK